MKKVNGIIVLGLKHWNTNDLIYMKVIRLIKKSNNIQKRHEAIKNELRFEPQPI